MKFSIIIPAYNEEKLLSDSLSKIKRSLDVFLERGHNFELIVCDNNSSDRTAEIAREAGAKVVFETVNQISRARNTGAAAATGDYLIFIDADSYPPPELFREFLDRLTTENAVGGGALVWMETLDPVATFTLHLWRCISRCLKWAPGSFIFCKSDLFHRLGGFSTELYASEEIDFSRRLKREVRRRKEGRVIILKNSIQTSNRKLHLYGTKEYLRLIRGFLFRGKKMLKDRDALNIWYDGRR